MTDSTEDIPDLEGLDSADNLENMADDNFCQCIGAKTKDIVKRNNNKCPNTDCGKKLTDIPGYEQDEPSKSEQSLKIFTDWLEGIS